MALDPHREVTHAGEPPPAPRLFHRPSDAPPPLERIGDSGPLDVLRRELSAQQRPRRSARYWAGRISGRSRRRFLLALGTATVALAEQCDRLRDRVMANEEVTEDVAATLGEELARLRAEVLHLRTRTISPAPGADG